MSSSRPHNLHDTNLFSYTIASADMRYIERAERHITLCRNPSNELYMRGEMPDCGPDCYLDLGQVVIEYAMSCEGCREPDELEGFINHFGERIGQALSAKLTEEFSANDKSDLFIKVIECVLRSTDITFEVQQEGKHIVFELGQCPIIEGAKRYGVNRGKDIALQAFISLCAVACDAIVSGSQVTDPAKSNLSTPLHRLAFALP